MNSQRFNIFPTRLNYKLIQSKILSAKRGHSLLKSKSDVLQSKFKKIDELFKIKNEEIEEEFKKAFIMISKAEFYGGNLDSFLKHLELSELSIKTSIDQVCGVVLPRFEILRIEENQKFYLSNAGSILLEAKKSFEELFANMVEIGSMKNSYVLIKAALDATNRRMNALEFVLIPKLECTSNYILSELDEQEREEFFRMKKIQNSKKMK